MKKGRRNMESLRTVIDACKIKRQNIIYCVIVCFVLTVVFFLSQGIYGGKAEKIISLIVILTVVFLLLLYNKIEEKLHLFTFFFILFMGGISLLIQPIFNIPDEQVHFARSEWVSEGNFIVDTRDQYFEVIKTCEDLNEDRYKTYIQSEIVKEEVDSSLVSVRNIAAANLSIFYIPQALGIFFAKLLKTDVIWLLWSGRFFNLLFYAILSCVAIKITPRLKFLMFFVATLPISIQQAASFSVDASVNSLALLLIALFLNFYFAEEKQLNNKEIIFFVVISILLTLAKVTNIFLAGLFLLIPLKNFKTKKIGILAKIIVIGMVILSGGLYYYYTTTFASNLEATEFLSSLNVDSGAQIQYILSQPVKWLTEFCASMSRELNGYIGMLNTFGCLEYNLSLLTPVSIFMFSKICYQDQGISLDPFKKFLVILMIMGVYGASCIALYISWTPVGADYISGIQGRYFLPIIALLGMLLSSDKTKKIEDHISDIAIICCMVGSMLIVTATRYY